MAIDFEKLSFGNKNTPAKAANGDAPKAKFWLNIGYAVDVKDENGNDEERFVSLPQGIPLDTQEALPAKGKNQEWKAFQQARNGLLEQIMAAAQTLEPGEGQLLNLQIQLRRVNEEEVETTIENNPFARTLNL